MRTTDNVLELPRAIDPDDPRMLRVQLAFAYNRELGARQAADDARWLQERSERIADKLRGQLTRAYTRRFTSRIRTR